MEYTRLELTVPKAMETFLSGTTFMGPEDELKRNALLLYPFVFHKDISHGKAAEILGIRKQDLIDIYDDMGFSYFDMDIDQVLEDVRIFRNQSTVSDC